MRHLGKLAAVAIATLALITPAATQADPGINGPVSDGRVEFVGKTTCTWTGVPINALPPNPVTVTAQAATNAISCDNGYWGVVNEDLNVTFSPSIPPNTATIAVVDVTGGKFLFWCRYRATNVQLNSNDGITYTGSFQVPLHSSNLPSECSNPAQINASVTFRNAA